MRNYRLLFKRELLINLGIETSLRFWYGQERQHSWADFTGNQTDDYCRFSKTLILLRRLQHKVAIPSLRWQYLQAVGPTEYRCHLCTVTTEKNVVEPLSFDRCYRPLNVSIILVGQVLFSVGPPIPTLQSRSGFIRTWERFSSEKIGVALKSGWHFIVWAAKWNGAKSTASLTNCRKFFIFLCYSFVGNVSRAKPPNFTLENLQIWE